MRIAEIETFVIKTQAASAYMSSSGTTTSLPNSTYFRRQNLSMLFSLNIESLVVKVVTDSGVVGWGEAQAGIAPEVVREIIQKVLQPCLLEKDPLQPEVIWSEMYNTMRGRGQVSGFMLDAIAACDIALWDILGKVAKLPVCQLLGGAYNRRLWSYVSGITEDNIVHKCQEWIGRGFNALKLKLGFDPEEDFKIAQEVRNSIGPTIKLAVDVHWKYSDFEAIRLGRALETLDAFFLECPVATEESAGLASITKALDLPIAGGEEYRTRFEFRDRLSIHALDIVQPDVGRTGITEFKKIATLAETYGCPCAPHIGVGFGIYTAATLQVAAALSNFLIIEYQPLILPIANEILERPLKCEAGIFEVPWNPGLGIEVNEKRIKELSIS